MYNKVCSFFGHRNVNTTDELISKISTMIDGLVKNGYFTFLFGGFGDFDNLCHKIVSQKKELFPSVKRVYCLTDEKHLSPNKRPKYLSQNDYEEFIYLQPDFDYWYKRIYFRNCEMVKLSDFIIFYAEEKENSGAYKTLKFAKKSKKTFINLYN